MMTTTMTKQALTQHLGVSRVVCDRFISEGLPFETDAKGRQRFDAAQVARWLLARAEAAGGGPGVDKQRERLLRAQADSAELRLDRDRGELVELATVTRQWSATWRNVRDLLRSIPRSASDRLMAVSDNRAVFAAALLSEIDDALTRASTMPIPRADTDDDEDDGDDA